MDSPYTLPAAVTRLLQVNDTNTMPPTLLTLAPSSYDTEAPTYDSDFDDGITYTSTSIAGFIENHPLFGTILLLASIICTISVYFALRQHLRELYMYGPSDKRKYFITICTFPFVLSVSCVLSVLFPRVAVWFQILVAVCESFCLLYFCYLLTDLAGGEDALVALLTPLGERKFFISPPCCCIGYCFAPAPFTKRTLYTCYGLVMQNMILSPILALSDAMNDSMDQQRSPLGIIISQALSMISVMLCFWGLLVLYFNLKEHLKEHRPTQKFLGIKGMLILTSLQETLLYILIATGVIDNEDYSTKAWAAMWNCMLLSFELVVLNQLVLSSYPGKELPYPLDEADERIRLTPA